MKCGARMTIGLPSPNEPSRGDCRGEFQRVRARPLRKPAAALPAIQLQIRAGVAWRQSLPDRLDLALCGRVGCVWKRDNSVIKSVHSSTASHRTRCPPPGITRSFAPGISLCEHSRILRPDQPVQISGHDERRASDLGERLRAVELGKCLKLQVRSMQRRRQGGLPPHLILGLLVVFPEIVRCVGDSPDPSCDLLRGKPIQIAHDSHNRSFRIGRARAAAHGGAEDQPGHALRKLSCEFLGDGATHRITEQIGAFDADLVEKASDVARHVGESVAG